jgi:GxxExxY protein
MNSRKDSHPHMELTESIIGAAMAVHREMGPGLDEKIYENALCL